MEVQKSHHNITAAVLALWLLVLACSSSLPVSSTNVPDITGSIIYSSDESGNFEIYHTNVKTKVKNRLTDNTSQEITPFYFPPAHIGFVSDKSGKYQIYQSAFDGSAQLSWNRDDKYGVFTPSVSPDGKRIAYVVQTSDKNSDLYVSNLEGDKVENLTDASGLDWDPSWSPDGRRIAFSTSTGDDWEIHIINVDDGRLTKLTENTFYDGRPRWSPVGDQILFESDRDGDWELYLMDADGENVRQITENGSVDWSPSWSPDGQWIVYASGQDGDEEIYIVGVDGTQQMKLTNNTAQDRFPAWIP